jgi:hypothetical protein
VIIATSPQETIRAATDCDTIPELTLS